MVCLGKHRSSFLEPKHSWTLGNEGRGAIERLDFLIGIVCSARELGFLFQAVESTERFLSQGLIWCYGHIET